MSVPLDDNFSTVPTANGREYRFRKSLLGIGLLCTAFFLAMAIISPIGAPVPTAIVFGVFWSCWTILGLWLILAYFRVRLYITGQWVRMVGSFRTRTLRFDELSSGRWRVIPAGGSLVLHGPAGKIVIEFMDFKQEEPNELIHFFRQALDERRQENWPAFEGRFFPTPEALRKDCQKNKRRLRFGYVAHGVIFLAAAVFFAYLSPLQPAKQWWYLTLAIVNAVAGPLCLIRAWKLRTGTESEGSSEEAKQE